VTLNGNLDLTRSRSGGMYVSVYNGLTLNGTAYVGAADGSTAGRLLFEHKETLGGTGQVLFGGSGSNLLQIDNPNLTLTVAAGITVHGRRGNVVIYYGN